MLLDISEILRTVGSSFKFVLDESDLKLEGLELASPVGGSVTVTNSGARLLIRGSAWGDVVLQCGRCLKAFIYPVDAEIEEDFDIKVIQRVASRQKVEDDTLKALFEGAAINLNELILQEFTLSLPISPVCSADCFAPCPACGKPADACGCPPNPDTIDPRWAPLAERLHDRS
jgi:uncharacterized protein